MKIKDFIPRYFRSKAGKYLEKVMLKSLESAGKEEGLQGLSGQLRRIVPDISGQYSTFRVDSLYLKTKVRNMHAFQISLVAEIINEFKNPFVVDIGDSSGTHLQYILALYSQCKNLKCLSVNIDESAIERMKQKGLEVLHSKAEDFYKYDIPADFFLCFEVLEHLMNPCLFLHQLSTTKAKYLIITVPYVKISRVGLHHIEASNSNPVCAERTHIFELSPKDWKLIIRHSGWGVVKERIYFQYPRNGFLRITKPLWKKFDFEGFYGLILKKDNLYSSSYTNW